MRKEFNKLPKEARIPIYIPGSPEKEYFIPATLVKSDKPSSTKRGANALYDAINNGVCKIVFAGTSITKGIDAQTEPYNIWTKEFVRQLTAKYPDVNFTDINYGLNSRNIYMLSDLNFKGVASPDPGDGTGFYEAADTYAWQNASEEGKTWLNHIKDEKPDVVVLGFGMNWTGSADDFESYYQLVIDRLKAAEKIPSIVLLTEMLPSKKSDPYLDLHGQKKLLNEKIRTLATANDCLLIDVERKWSMLDSGQDFTVMQQKRFALDTFTKIAANVADTLTYNSIDKASSNSVYGYEFDTARDCIMTCTYTPNGVGSLCQIGARFKKSESESWAAGLAVQVGHAAVTTWENGATVQTTGHSAIVASSPHDVEISIVGPTITVTIDSVVVDTYTVTSKRDCGNIAVGVNDGLMADVNFTATEYFPILETAKYTNNELLGNKSAANWTSGDTADGGNSFNHPSRIGLFEAYYPAITEFINTLN